ncbi:MAG: DUF262 domain-containing protein [Candidatus Binatus sp.]|uniref:DUF262 domain-containing protein n=1 Tax=Candidatus Binatus sp. TaxID=2811406 RepID=UPI003C7063B5
MKSETCTIQQLFQDRRQYRVPFYQRAYVWEKETQWQPLWQDIVDKAEFRRGGDAPPPHFLGAIVLEPQARSGLRGVETLNIIDGQQRLTTIQYFLCALRIHLRARSMGTLQSLVDACLWNSNTDTMEQPDIEVFKVWPTFRDRQDYQRVMRAQDTAELVAEFPESFTQGGTLRKIGISHSPALESIWFFHGQIEGWLDDIGNQEHAPDCLEQLTSAAFRDLKVVSIILQEEDDAQVIFETLNGRGAELHATDLIRNYIFMRADREGSNAAELYDTYWTPFESSFWTDDQRRGRLIRPRLEWFVHTTLQAKVGEEIEMARLYMGYRRFAFNQSAAVSADNQLRTLTAYADEYRQFISGTGSRAIAEVGRRIHVWDVSPAHPLILRVATEVKDEAEQGAIYGDLLSYVVRRAICGLTTKNYNKVFLQLLKRFASGAPKRLELASALASLEGIVSRWPGDEEFRHAWLTAPVHSRLGEIARIRAVLTELENGLRSARSEEPFVAVNDTLDVDHILPDKWYEHWLLEGTSVSEEEASRCAFATLIGDVPPRIKAILRREELKATWGNLTMAHYGVNRSLQHCPFNKKREAFYAESNLQLNRILMRSAEWTEKEIETRGEALFAVARRIWPGPVQLT